MTRKLSQSQLKRLMQLEMRKLMDEDALFMQKRIPGDYDYDVVNFQRSKPMSVIDIPHDYDDERDIFPYDDEDEDDGCLPTMGMHTPQKSHMMIRLDEKDCGCHSKNPYSVEREKDFDLDYHDPEYGHIQIRDIDDILSDAFGTGHSEEIDGHRHSSYMARPQLYKISKYASKLLDMIGENEELQDWQESKIAQIAQMIGSVYHSLDYDEEYDDDELILSNLI